MRLAVVPRVPIADPIIPGLIGWGPSLPASLSGKWATASSDPVFAGAGMVLCWLWADEEEVVELAAAGVGVIPDVAIGIEASSYGLLREPHPRTADLLDLNAAIRAATTMEARRDALLRRNELLRPMLRDSEQGIREVFEAVREAAVVIERQWNEPPAGVVAAYTALASDSFNRSNRALQGDAMDAAGGGSGNVWGSADASYPAITSNTAHGDGANWKFAYDSTMAAADKQQVSTTGNQQGPTTRHQGATNDNSYSFLWSGVAYVSISTLGSILFNAGSAPGAGATLTLRSEGSSHSGFTNGSPFGGPATDASYASGVHAFVTQGNSASGAVDDYLGEQEVAAAASRMTLLGTG